MISVQEAQKIILSKANVFSAETVRLEDAYGRVLREDIKADRDQPAFDKSTMDGIAIRFETWQKGTRTFVIEGITPAGEPGRKLKRPDGCIQIMTGAVLPQGCNTVVPVEQVVIQNKKIIISDKVSVKKGQFVRWRGTDCKKGKILFNKGRLLLPPQIASAASFGKLKLNVTRRPKVAVIATGDELVDIGRANIKPYQIRKSNSYALDAMLRQTGLCETRMFHFVDDKKLMLRQIKKILNAFDVLVLSGGVSMGEFDYVPQVLKELGVRILFHKVSQKPGKPFWFGQNAKGRMVFALPGNPVSTQICAYRYLIPYLQKAVGLPYNRTCWAVLAETLSVNTDLTYFAPVKIIPLNNGTLSAAPVLTGGSGDYASLSLADGFVELEGGRRQFPKGFAAPYYSW